MPTYEYRCEKCGRFEEFQRMSDEPLSRCPTCGGPVRRLISRNVGIVFKGSGFYTTDNRSSEYKDKARKDGESVSSSGSSNGSSKTPDAAGV
ncbi:MAG: zinc ribbon domain-containing protein [Bacillota bacterium]|nr:zinc ribbon domain-containing protein [Bacillota bacterium]